MKYRILQLRREFQRSRLFRPLEAIGAADLNHYESVYTGEIEDAGSDKAVLDCLFETFNINRPDDFHGHSLSMSDVIMLDNSRLWYCDRVGWVALTGENAPVAKSVVTIDVGARS